MNVAIPEPFTALLPMVVEPLLDVTVPVGVPEMVALTFAVSTIGAPRTAEFALDASVVAVFSWIVCVSPAGDTGHVGRITAIGCGDGVRSQHQRTCGEGRCPHWIQVDRRTKHVGTVFECHRSGWELQPSGFAGATVARERDGIAKELCGAARRQRNRGAILAHNETDRAASAGVVG